MPVLKYTDEPESAKPLLEADKMARTAALLVGIAVVILIFAYR